MMSAFEDSQKIVLLVSDNQADIRKIEKQFMDGGSLNLRLFRCSNMEGMREQLGKRGIKAHVIMLDLRLPDVASPEIIYREVKELAKGTPVIVLTDDDEAGMTQAEPVMAAGASGHAHRGEFNMLPKLIGSLLFQRGMA